MASPDEARDPLFNAELRISSVLGHPSTSYWLKDALSRALDRDPVDAVNDAEALHELLVLRTAAVFDRLLDAATIDPALRR